MSNIVRIQSRVLTRPLNPWEGDELKLYQLILVHQGGGMWCDDQNVWHSRPHDCSDNSLHWVSRIIEFEDDRGLVQIATPVNGNPCHREWPYYADMLEPVSPEYDWATSATRAVGDDVHFTLSESTPQYKVGTAIQAKILSPHIELGDWYVTFPTPDGWLFRMVVNEREFTPLLTTGNVPLLCTST